MTTNESHGHTIDDAKAVAEKLQSLRENATPAQQQVLDQVLAPFLALADKASTVPAVQRLLAEIPDAPALLDDVAAFAQVPGGPTDTHLMPITVTITDIPWEKISREPGWC
jgi:hypothetical protein